MLLYLLAREETVTSTEANTNLWIFILTMICAVIGYLAIQQWKNTGRISGVRVNYQILSSKVDDLSAKVDAIDTKLSLFLKQEIDILKDLTRKK